MAALLSLLFVVGGVIGGGPTSPILSMIVELIACVLGAVGIAGIIDGHYPREAWPALVLLILICAVPMLQLIPLPATLGARLPGREVPDAILRLIGADGNSRPLSLDPEQTRLAMLTLSVPAATFIASLQLTRSSRELIFKIIVAFSFISAIFGVFQVAKGGIDLGIYPTTHSGFPIGFFANRNHEADLLLIAMPFSACIIDAQNWPKRTKSTTLAGSIVVFSLAVAATQSRTGLALIPLALLTILAIQIGNVRDVRFWKSVVGLGAFLIAGYAVFSLTPVGTRVSRRFSDVANDLRPHIWAGTREAISNFWPAGSGIGTFPPVYNMFEDLNSVRESWVNHAHNDYLELLLVAGLPAALLLITFTVLFIASLTRRLPFPLRGQRYAGVGALLILLIHSTTDYPLRTFALLAIFAFSAALLYPSNEVQGRRKTANAATSLERLTFDADHA